MRERKRDTLLNKIMRLLAKIMGINIKDNSLYAQEFEVLRNAMNTEPIDIDKVPTLKADMSSKPNINADNDNINNDNTDNNEADNNDDVDTNDNKKESANKKALNIINDETDDEEYSSTTEILEDELSSELQEIKNNTIEEYETVASIGDYIQSYSPEDRAEIAREINNGNISIKCK